MTFVSPDLAEEVGITGATASDGSKTTEGNLNDDNTGTQQANEVRESMLCIKITHDLGFAVADLDPTNFSFRIFDGAMMTAADGIIYPYSAGDSAVVTGNEGTLAINDNGAYDTLLMSEGFVADLEDVGTNQISIRFTAPDSGTLRGRFNEVQIEFFEDAGGDQTVNSAPAVVSFAAPATATVKGPISAASSPAFMTFVAVAPTLLLTNTLNSAPAVMTFFGPALTVTPGNIAVGVTPAFTSFFAPAPTVAGGPVSLTVSPAFLTFFAPSPVVTNPLVLNSSPAFMSLAAVAITTTPGPVSVASVPASMAFVAVAPVVTPGAISVGVVPAFTSFFAPASTVTPGPISASSLPSILTFFATVPTVIGGPISVSSTPAFTTFFVPAVSASLDVTAVLTGTIVPTVSETTIVSGP